MCEKKENRVSLPSYAWSPWKEGRSKEEQRELQEIQEIRIPDGVRELGNYTFSMKSMFPSGFGTAGREQN